MQIYDNGDRQALKYSVACAHGEFLLDRAARFQWFLARHAACNPRWAPLTQQPGESPEQHAQRLKALFPFERSDNTPVVRVKKAVSTPGVTPCARHTSALR